MPELLFEIFSEELPATLQLKIQNDYVLFIKKVLQDIGINYSNNDLTVGITPNRLVLFLTADNINNDNAKQIAKITLKDFSNFFPRTMCYPQFQQRWLRPIRSIFLCIDNVVIDDTFFGIKTNNGTYIDKFDFVRCPSVAEYKKIITDNNIELNYNKRFEFIKNEIFKKNSKYNNKKLIEELAGMNEYCIEPIEAVLDEKFSVLPFELIELVLRENQRYVVFNQNDNTNEINFLIFGGKITNNKDKKQNILNGHQKVVDARLEDALYYLQKDKTELEKFGLEGYKEKLKNALFQKTFIDDISFSVYLSMQEQKAEQLLKNQPDILNETKKLIFDTKIDLMTGVVAEFPELQGIIGRYYFGYNFNPYELNKEIVLKEVAVLYYYLIDRITYIETMNKQDKMPTGSGDKYKVKARMDDIIFLFVNKLIDGINMNDIIKNNNEIKQLFLKRLQKYIEDNFKNVENIKFFAKTATQIFDKIDNFDIKQAIQYYTQEQFTKTYKRIRGYTQNIEVKQDNDQLTNLIDKIFPNQNLIDLNSFLDNNKINDSQDIKEALKLIEIRFFEPKLPFEFIKNK